MTKTTARKKAAKLKLKEIIRIARAAGVEISIGLSPNRMPPRFDSDHEHVKWLCDESERVAGRGNNWAKAKTPNPKSAKVAWEIAWAYALAAAWLRARIKGDVGPQHEAEDTTVVKLSGPAKKAKK